MLVLRLLVLGGMQLSVAYLLFLIGLVLEPGMFLVPEQSAAADVFDLASVAGYAYGSSTVLSVIAVGTVFFGFLVQRGVLLIPEARVLLVSVALAFVVLAGFASLFTAAFFF